MKKICDKLMIIFIFIQPFLDMLISFGIRNNNKLSYLGTILRGSFFFIMIIYLFINNKNRKVIYCFLIYFILSIGYYKFFTSNNIVSEISNILQIFYIIFVISFFNNYKNEGINSKLLTIVYLIYTLSLPIAYIFNLGFDINELYFNKHGFLGLFYSGNELCGLLIALVPFVVEYIKEKKNIIIIILSTIGTLSAIYFLGSKTLVLALIIFILYFIYLNRTNKKILISFIGVLVLSGILIPFTSTYKNIVANLDFYNIKTSNLISIDNLDKLVFSMRISYVKNVNHEYMNSSIGSKIFGIGKTRINQIKDTEIDCTDIFYTIGLMGSIIYLVLLILIIKEYKIEGFNKFTFILLVLISFFAGHIFTKASVLLYVGLLFKKK